MLYHLNMQCKENHDRKYIFISLNHLKNNFQNNNKEIFKCSFSLSRSLFQFEVFCSCTVIHNTRLLISKQDINRM